MRTIAPNVVFIATRDPDPDYVWDGDGPDPIDDDFEAYNVDVTVNTVVDGKAFEAVASLGGCYFKDDEPIDDLHGYLPQKLEEAASELHGQVPDSNVKDQLSHAIAMLKQEMTDRWQAQQDAAEEQLTYSIIRFHKQRPNETIATGLSLEEAQTHCADSDTEGKDWFDGYNKE